ncbi:ABC transporter permease [Millionella massiliensis]|uniref:ABC transporter permease n=1 Tax=Millionella massiliensis TaxID=1871023 RepID=UPI0008D8ED7D|nr:ABC transporter permease [Millionella massiliensis]
MKLETFIARRLGHTGRKSGIMLRVATLCVAVSVTVMLIALSVVNGFRRTVTEKVSGFSSDIQITAVGSGNSYEVPPVVYDPEFAESLRTAPGVTHVQRFATKAGIIRQDSTIQGIVLKGYAPETDTTFLHRQMVAGRIPVYSDTARSREAVISESLSRSLRLQCGDRFEVLFIGSSAPRRDRLRVAGIYNSGMAEFDRMTVIGDLAIVQRLNGWSRDQISGYELAVSPGADLNETAWYLSDELQPASVLDGWGEAAADTEDPVSDETTPSGTFTTPSPETQQGASPSTTAPSTATQGTSLFGTTADLATTTQDDSDNPNAPENRDAQEESEDSYTSPDLEITTVTDRYPQIFDWLQMLGLNTTIVIVIMLVVAVVNMSSGVLIVVLEQTRTIGILKALGMGNAPLQRTFIVRSVGITLRGVLWGDLIGLALCLIQQYTGVISLDPESYMMAAVPVRIDWLQVVALNLGTLAVITLSMVLPTAIIARITPDKSIRFQ